MNGFDLRAPGGTPKICNKQSMQTLTQKDKLKTHMREHLLHQPPPLCLPKPRIKTHDAPTPLQTIPRHLQLVHRVHVLDVQLEARPVRRLRRPEVQVLVPPRLEVERVVAVVQIRELGEEVQVVLRV